MSKVDFELIGEACALVRENPSVFAASGANLDREYSEATFRERDRVLYRTRLRRARPSPVAASRIPRGSPERQKLCERVAAVPRAAPRSVMARMASAMRMLGEQPDDGLGTEWAKAVLLLTFLVWDDSSDAPEWRFCEFGRLPYRLVDGAGSFQHRSGLKRIIGPGWSDIVQKALNLARASIRPPSGRRNVRTRAERGSGKTKAQLRIELAERGAWSELERTLTDRMRQVLRALRDSGAVSRNLRRTKGYLAEHKLYSCEPKLLDHQLADLVRLKLVESAAGIDGGYWLTPNGEEALRLEAVPAPPRTESRPCRADGRLP